jgi:hypothetical protein
MGEGATPFSQKTKKIEGIIGQICSEKHSGPTMLATVY